MRCSLSIISVLGTNILLRNLPWEQGCNIRKCTFWRSHSRHYRHRKEGNLVDTIITIKNTSVHTRVKTIPLALSNIFKLLSKCCNWGTQCSLIDEKRLICFSCLILKSNKTVHDFLRNKCHVPFYFKNNQRNSKFIIGLNCICSVTKNARGERKY